MGFSSVGIVGSGPIGCAISIAIARTDVPVVLVRAAHGSLASAERRIEARLGFFLDAGEMTGAEVARARARISVADDLTKLSQCDLVIESTSGDTRSRRATLATLESRLSPGAVLASHSPPERLRDLAEVLRRRDQFVGMHFFARGGDRAPRADVRPSLPSTQLVELGLLAETAPGVAAACTAFARSLGTTAVERRTGVANVEYREFLS